MDQERGKPKLTYRDAGVDIDAQDRALEKIKDHVKSTRTAGVLSELGNFGGLFALDLGRYEQPVLVRAPTAWGRSCGWLSRPVCTKRSGAIW